MTDFKTVIFTTHNTSWNKLFIIPLSTSNVCYKNLSFECVICSWNSKVSSYFRDQLTDGAVLCSTSTEWSHFTLFLSCCRFLLSVKVSSVTYLTYHFNRQSGMRSTNRKQTDSKSWKKVKTRIMTNNFSRWH